MQFNIFAALINHDWSCEMQHHVILQIDIRSEGYNSPMSSWILPEPRIAFF
jgi:hypothetical protein